MPSFNAMGANWNVKVTSRWRILLALMSSLLVTMVVIILVTQDKRSSSDPGDQVGGEAGSDKEEKEEEKEEEKASDKEEKEEEKASGKEQKDSLTFCGTMHETAKAQTQETRREIPWVTSRRRSIGLRTKRDMGQEDLLENLALNITEPDELEDDVLANNRSDRVPKHTWPELYDQYGMEYPSSGASSIHGPNLGLGLGTVAAGLSHLVRGIAARVMEIGKDISQEDAVTKFHGMIALGQTRPRRAERAEEVKEPARVAVASVKTMDAAGEEPPTPAPTAGEELTTQAPAAELVEVTQQAENQTATAGSEEETGKGKLPPSADKPTDAPEQLFEEQTAALLDPADQSAGDEDNYIDYEDFSSGSADGEELEYPDFDDNDSNSERIMEPVETVETAEPVETVVTVEKNIHDNSTSWDLTFEQRAKFILSALLDAVATIASRRKESGMTAIVISLVIAGTSLLLGVSATAAIVMCWWQRRKSRAAVTPNTKALNRMVVGTIDTRLEQYLTAAKMQTAKEERDNETKEVDDLELQEGVNKEVGT